MVSKRLSCPSKSTEEVIPINNIPQTIALVFPGFNLPAPENTPNTYIAESMEVIKNVTTSKRAIDLVITENGR